MSKETTATYTIRMATPQQLSSRYLKQLDKTPKWRVLKRRQLKRVINFWGKQV